MAVEFTGQDIKHRIPVKFIPNHLPDAKKPYSARTVHETELDVHGIAAKAEAYNIYTSPKVVEEGLLAAIKLITYLLADGYRIKTPLVNIGLRIPGEYTGSETSLPQGVFPEARVQVSAALRAYLRKHVNIEFDGFERNNGLIGEALDEATQAIDETATRGNLLVIRGIGLKIEGDEAHRDKVGLYFEPVEEGGTPVKADTIAVNKPRTLKVIVPAGLEAGKSYRLKVVTQYSMKTRACLLQEPREARSAFILAIQN